MNALQRLKAFKKPQPAASTRSGGFFVWKGVTHAVPSPATEAIPGFFLSSRGKAWAAYQAS